MHDRELLSNMVITLIGSDVKIRSPEVTSDVTKVIRGQPHHVTKDVISRSIP